MSISKRLYPTAAPSPRTVREAAEEAARLAAYQEAVARVALGQLARRPRRPLVPRVSPERVERVADLLTLSPEFWLWLYGPQAA